MPSPGQRGGGACPAPAPAAHLKGRGVPPEAVSPPGISISLESLPGGFFWDLTHLLSFPHSRPSLSPLLAVKHLHARAPQSRPAARACHAPSKPLFLPSCLLIEGPTSSHGGAGVRASAEGSLPHPQLPSIRSPPLPSSCPFSGVPAAPRPPATQGPKGSSRTQPSPLVHCFSLRCPVLEGHLQ